MTQENGSGSGPAEGSNLPQGSPLQQNNFGLNPSHNADIPQPTQARPRLNDPGIMAVHATLDPNRDTTKIMVGETNVVEDVATQWEDIVKGMGEDAERSKQMMRDFMLQNEPFITAAIAAGDAQSLDYLKAQLMGRMGRVSLGLIYKERQRAIDVIITALSIAMKL